MGRYIPGRHVLRRDVRPEAETASIVAFLQTLTGDQPRIVAPRLPASDARSPLPDKDQSGAIALVREARPITDLKKGVIARTRPDLAPHRAPLSMVRHLVMPLLVPTVYACMPLRENFPNVSNLRESLKT